MPAATTSDAERKSLALYAPKMFYMGQKTYVLYDCKMLIDYFEVGEADVQDVIYGMIAIDENGSCPIVRSSAARKGYGPLLYDIVMCVEGCLIPDRKSVSPSARRVWDSYSKRPDVERRSLKPGGASNDPLDYSYTLKGHPNFDALLRNHSRCLSSLDIDESEIERLAEEYFATRLDVG
jgi:hypothetical protein